MEFHPIASSAAASPVAAPIVHKREETSSYSTTSTESSSPDQTQPPIGVVYIQKTERQSQKTLLSRKAAIVKLQQSLPNHHLKGSSQSLMTSQLVSKISFYYPTFKKFFDAVWREELELPPLTDSHITQAILSAFIAKGRHSERALRTLVDEDILYKPCMTRWKKVHFLLMTYFGGNLKTKIGGKLTPKTMTDEKVVIEQLQKFLDRTDQITGLGDFLRIFNDVPKEMQRCRKLVYIGVSKNKKDRISIINLLKFNLTDYLHLLENLDTERDHQPALRKLNEKDGIKRGVRSVHLTSTSADMSEKSSPKAASEKRELHSPRKEDLLVS